MTRIILYGCAAGAITIGSAILGMVMSTDATTHLASLEWLGYAIMILALSLVFVGVKRYRDADCGGVIGFKQALWVGLGMTLVASLLYVVAWEAYLAVTDHAFIGQYAASVIESKRASGANEAEVQAVAAEMQKLQTQYANPLYRLPMTFLEIFPVGLLVSLISATVLRTRGRGVPPASA